MALSIELRTSDLPQGDIAMEPFMRPCVRQIEKSKRLSQMLKWILILLIVAAVASLLGLNTISGAALTGAKILIGIVLVIFILVVLGIVAIA